MLIIVLSTCSLTQPLAKLRLPVEDLECLFGKLSILKFNNKKKRKNKKEKQEKQEKQEKKEKKER